MRQQVTTEDRGTSRRLGGQTIRKLGDAVCDPHRTRGADGKQRFSGLGLKTTATVSWFEPQNQVEEVYRFAPQNRRADEDGAGTRVDIGRLASERGKSR